MKAGSDDRGSELGKGKKNTRKRFYLAGEDRSSRVPAGKRKGNARAERAKQACMYPWREKGGGKAPL